MFLIILELIGCVLWILTQINWNKVKRERLRQAVQPLLADIVIRKRFKDYYRSLGIRKSLIGSSCFSSANLILGYVESNEFSTCYPEFLQQHKSDFALCRQFQAFRDSNLIVPEFSELVSMANCDSDSQLILMAKHYFSCIEIVRECCNGHPELSSIADKIDRSRDKNKPIFERNRAGGRSV